MNLFLKNKEVTLFVLFALVIGVIIIVITTGITVNNSSSNDTSNIIQPPVSTLTDSSTTPNDVFDEEFYKDYLTNTIRVTDNPYKDTNLEDLFTFGFQYRNTSSMNIALMNSSQFGSSKELYERIYMVLTYWIFSEGR
jgi:hypothetical protein